MTDCICTGQWSLKSPCEAAATEDDGLCDRCRENGCAAKREEILRHLREHSNVSEATARILARWEAMGE